MKIQYLSDLHLERKIDYLDLIKSVVINKNNADILVLAGDILKFSLNEYEYSDIFQYFSENWEYTLYIPGNHEYYKNYPLSLEPIEIQLKDNVFFCNNKIKDIKGVRFLLSTFWTYIDPFRQMTIERRMNDFYKIRTDNLSLLKTDFWNKLHNFSKEFVFSNLSNELENIVVTHHGPVSNCVNNSYKGDPLNSAFINNYDNLVCDNNIKYWIYGHTHYNKDDFDVNGTSIISNQYGYYGDPLYINGKVIEL